MPAEIRDADNSCGAWVVWGILTHFGIAFDAAGLVQQCQHSIEDGIYAPAIALVLHRHGLKVEYFTDYDPDSSELEKRLNEETAERGIGPFPSIEFKTLLSRVSQNSIPAVLYQLPNSEPHWNVVLGKKRPGVLAMPYFNPPVMGIERFVRAWNAERIFRTCVLAQRKTT
jgi:hypothetical protein